MRMRASKSLVLVLAAAWCCVTIAIEDAKKLSKYQVEMARICKSLSVEPMALDMKVVKSGETLKATSVLVNRSNVDFVIPPGVGGAAVLGY